MSRIVEPVRRNTLVAGVGAALLLTGVGFGAATVTSGDGPAVRETADIASTSAPTVATTTSPVPDGIATAVTTPTPVPSAATPAPTVDAVTAPEPATGRPADGPADGPAAPTPTAAPSSSYDPEAPWVDSNGLTYIPAPDVPAPKLPGEPGYVPPAP